MVGQVMIFRMTKQRAWILRVFFVERGSVAVVTDRWLCVVCAVRLWLTTLCVVWCMQNGCD